VGFGAWAVGGAAYGNSYGPTDDETSRAAIRQALALGCTFFDTADVYGHGHSESLLGEVLAGEGWRASVVLATKVGGNFYNTAIDPALAPHLASYLGQPLTSYAPGAVLPVTHRLSFAADYIRFACEQSLRRLRTDVIDLYQLHNPSLDVLRADETWTVLADLKAAGKIRFCGVSIHDAAEGHAAIASGQVDALQVVYNLLDREAAQTLFPLAQEAHVGIIAREPLANGLLAGRYQPGTTFDTQDHRSRWPSDYLNQRINAAHLLLANIPATNATPAQLAIRFALDHPAVSTVIPGAKTPAQVAENLAAADLPSLENRP
jgi:aryl-alcohol dehydrogenase-like predicted oxidoreductase